MKHRPKLPDPLTTSALQQILDTREPQPNNEKEGQTQSLEEQLREEQAADRVLTASEQILSHSLSWRQWQQTLSSGRWEAAWEAEEIDEALWESLQDSLWESWLRQLQQQWEMWWKSAPQEPAERAALLWQVPLSTEVGAWTPRGQTQQPPPTTFPLFAMFVPLQSSPQTFSTQMTPQWMAGDWHFSTPTFQPLVFRVTLQNPGYVALIERSSDPKDQEESVSLIYPQTREQDQFRHAGIHDLFFYRFLEAGDARFLLLQSPHPVTSWLNPQQWRSSNEEPGPIPLPMSQWQECLQKPSIQGFPFSLQLVL